MFTLPIFPFDFALNVVKHFDLLKNNYRSEFQGIQVHYLDENSYLVFASNGRFALYKKVFAEVEPFQQFLISAAQLKNIKPHKNGVICGDLTKDGNKVNFFYNGMHYLVDCGNILFDGYKRVIPEETSNKPGQFTHKSISEFGKFADALKLQMYIAHNGESAAVIKFSDKSIFGLLMPMLKHLYEKAEAVEINI